MNVIFTNWKILPSPSEKKTTFTINYSVLQNLMSFNTILFFSNNNNMSSIDEDRRRRLRDIEVKIQDPRSIINVDCLIDAVQNIMSDCDHPAIRKIKNIDAFVTRCKPRFQHFSKYVHTYTVHCRPSMGKTPRSLSTWVFSLERPLLKL